MPALHFFLSFAKFTSSAKDNPEGVPINIFPGSCISNCALTACFTRRLSGIRRIWPSQRYLRCRTAPTRSKDLVRGLASRCALLWVKCDRHLALHPFIFAIVDSVRFQASLPYVNNEHTAA